MDNQHEPAPEFVQALEQELIRVLRAGTSASGRSTRFTSRGGWSTRQRVAATFLLVTGLLVGAGGQFAYAQAQQSSQRTALLREKQMERDILVLQLGIVQQALTVAQQAYESGATSRQAVVDATSELKRQQIELQRLDLDVEEVRRSAAPPRNELWAPKVGNRDFVMERLQLEAASTQERVRSAEFRWESARTAFRTGAQTAIELATAEAEHAQIAGAFERVALKLGLRERAMQEALTMEQVSRELRLNDARVDYRTVQQLVTLAEARLELVTRNHTLGAATALDLKRAELEVLERRDEASLLALKLRVLERLPEEARRP